jgi:hypothetical protein
MWFSESTSSEVNGYVEGVLYHAEIDQPIEVNNDKNHVVSFLILNSQLSLCSHLFVRKTLKNQSREWNRKRVIISNILNRYVDMMRFGNANVFSRAWKDKIQGESSSVSCLKNLVFLEKTRLPFEIFKRKPHLEIVLSIPIEKKWVWSILLSSYLIVFLERLGSHDPE